MSLRSYRSQKELVLTIEKEWQVAQARVVTGRLAAKAGFGAIEEAHLSTTVSELGYNLIFHSERGGLILVHSVYDRARHGIRLVSEDSGPGIPCLDSAMTDGFSTNGGLGGGLPGVSRLMDEFAIESGPDGTRVECIKWAP